MAAEARAAAARCDEDERRVELSCKPRGCVPDHARRLWLDRRDDRARVLIRI
jgi:hypothetical protein